MTENVVTTQSVLALECRTCQHRWPEVYTLPMRVESFVARSKGVRCPHCGNSTGRPSREAILILQDEPYREAMRDFRERGLIRPAGSTRGPGYSS